MMKPLLTSVAALLAVTLVACGGGSSAPDAGFDSGVPIGGGGGGGGGGITEITLGVDGGQRLVNPRFSPDGTKIAFTQLGSQDDELAVMNTDGSGHTVLGSNASYLTGFDWSEDGSELYFSGNSLYRMPAGGGASEQLLTGLGGFASYDPDLSPDGTRLVYAVNGSTLQLVDLTQTPPTVSPLPVRGNSPRFSPDGTAIVYADRETNFIRLVDADGGNVRDVVASDGFFASVDWFSDGERIVATTDEGLEIVTVATGARRRLRSDGAVLSLDLSADDKRLVFTVNGQLPLYVMSGF